MKKRTIGFVVLVLLCSSINPAGAATPAATPPPWEPITGNETNMIALGPVYRNGVQLAGSRYWVASYGPGGIETDCRSVGQTYPDGTYYATIRGNTDGDTIRFKIWDGVTAQAFDAAESLTYQGDGTEDPFPLHFTQSFVYLPLVLRGSET